MKFVCPRHNCANSGLPEGKGVALLQCARCPIAYHEQHVPAGCTIHYDNILCVKHYDLLEPGRKPPTLLACVVCGDGGDLVCCDTCPGCYHDECIQGKLGYLDLGQAQGAQKLWRCPDCVNGTKACVGDVVWAKVGRQRFFPAIIKDEKDWPKPSVDEVAAKEESLAANGADDDNASTASAAATASAPESSAQPGESAGESSVEDEELSKLNAKMARKKAKEEALRQEELEYEAYLQELLENHREGEFPVQFLGTEEWAWANHTNTIRWEKGDEKGRFTVGAKAELREALQLAVVAHEERRAAVAAKRAEVEQILAADAKPQPYKKIKANIYTMERPWLKAEREKNAACMCTADHPCDDDRCLNASTLVECDPKTCPAGGACRNRHFQRRDGPKVASFPTPGRGFGLMTKDSIAEGEFCLEYMGEVITAEECGRRMHEDGREGEGAFYMLALEGDQIIDARPAANLARFANHACDPNMVMKKWNVLGQTRAGLFACKDIAAGEELTWNYQLDSFEGHAKMPCLCGAANCSGWIGMKPKQLESPTANQLPPKKKRRTKAKNSAASPPSDGADGKASPEEDRLSHGDADGEGAAAPKQKRKPKYLMRLIDENGDDNAAEASDDSKATEHALDGESEVSQPLVGADIQLHSFGEPLPNVWAMKATGEWEAFEAKRAEQERKKELIRENERKRLEAKLRVAERKAREFWAAQNVFGLRRGCWERRLAPHGDSEQLRARILAFEFPATLETAEGNGTVAACAASPSLWDERERAKSAAAIKKDWSKVGLNPAIKGCRERRIWPGGHLPELRDRLIRFDTGQPMSEAELQDYESAEESEEESEEEEIDSEEERALEAEKERKRKEREAWKKLTPAEQAALKAAEKERVKAERKAQVEALHERMRTLRQSPPEKCLSATTGKVDPLESGLTAASAAQKKQFPKEWVDGWAASTVAFLGVPRKKGSGGTAARPLPASEELGEWTREALAAFWEVRFKFWESRKLKECQKGCVSRSLSNVGETFDIRLRCVMFEIGGGPRLLELEELAEPLRTAEKKSRREEQKRKEAAAAEAKKLKQRERNRLAALKQKALEDSMRKDIPEVSHGEVCMVEPNSAGLKAEVQQMAIRNSALPSAQVLRGWTLESQHRFWDWRWEYWGRKKLKDLQAACKKFNPAVWPGGDARDVRLRLCKAEFDPASLKAAEWGVFFTLADKWIEVDFGEDGWFLGYVEKQVPPPYILCDRDAYTRINR